MHTVAVVRRLRRGLLASPALTVVLAGCSIGGIADVSSNEMQPPEFLECSQTTEFAFAGETTLAQIGLEHFGGGPDATRVGKIWVTARPVAIGGPAQFPAGMEPPPLQRLVCVEWPDGSAMAGSIDDAWQPPGGFASQVGADAGPGLPGPLIALVIGALVLVGVSLMAFRSRSATGA